MTNMVEQQILTVEHSAASVPEISEKMERIAGFLDRHKLSALLLGRHENIAWATAGRVEARVALGTETAVASLLLTRDGRRYYIAPVNEGPRLAAEEFAGLGFEPILYPWYESAAPQIHRLTGGEPVGSDTGAPGTARVDLGSLRTPLLPAEMDRFRALGRLTTEATVTVLESLEPGLTEYEMAARTAAALLARGLTPTVLLMGTDDRIRKYKHAVPRGGVLKRYGMVNLCARKWGLVVSITRFVHFGPLPQDLAVSFRHAAHIHSELVHATRPGATAATLYAAAQKAYATAGAPGEIELHHQGGPCGYVERSWLIAPAGEQRVDLPQGFAYNPSLRGAKVEDTVLVTKQGIEVLTGTPSLPTLETTIDQATYRSAGVFIK